MPFTRSHSRPSSPTPQSRSHLEDLAAHHQPSHAPVVPFSRSWHLAKLVLGGISLFSCITILPLSIYLLITFSRAKASVTSFSICIIIIGITISWYLADTISRCTAGDKRGLHPGTAVALHLIIWLACALTSFLFGASSSWTSGYRYSTTYDNGETTWHYVPIDDGTAPVYYVLRRVVFALVSLLLLVHFILFVRACVETHQRRSVTRTLVLLPNGQLTGPAMMHPMIYLPPKGTAHQQYAAYPQVSSQSTLQGYFAPPAAPPTAPAATLRDPVPPAQVVEYYTPQSR